MMKRCSGMIPWAIFVICTAVVAQAQTFTSLRSFDGGHGANPTFAPLVQGTNGSFYGTAAGGGIVHCNGGCGTVFEITRQNSFRMLYAFCGQSSCSDGTRPNAGLVLSTDGNLYGTTSAGGTNNSGTVFKISSKGTLTTLYSFCMFVQCADGSSPIGGLVQGIDGNFYGTAAYGGANGFGTVFRITPRGKLTTIYDFCAQANCADGSSPYGSVVQGDDGAFYGTTSEGGTYCPPDGCGTVFKVSSSGTLVTIHSFDLLDGEGPYGRLVQALDGNFYGTTFQGGDTTQEEPPFRLRLKASSQLCTTSPEPQGLPQD